MLRALALVLAALAAHAEVLAQRSPIAVPRPIPSDLTPRVSPSQCGDFVGHFGPLDFRTADERDRRVVQQYHFDLEAQTFLSGRVVGRHKATPEVGPGFAYTLKAFPNHPTALLLMEQLGRRLNTEVPQGNEWTMECWFLRGFMIAPDDPAVRALYGVYLSNRGRAAEAISNLAIAEPELQFSAPLLHQVGMAYVNLKQWEPAQRVAMRLAELGFSIDSVARSVRDAGRWNPDLKPAPQPAVPEGAASAPRGQP